MPKVSKAVRQRIDKIKELADGSTDDLLKAKDKLITILPECGLRKNIDASVIPELLPVIIKFLESDNQILQKCGANFVYGITRTPDYKVNTKLVIDADIIPKLNNLLSSADDDVLINSLIALVNITYFFPEKMVENLPLFITYLKSEKEEFFSLAVLFMSYVAQKENIPAILEANGIEPLLKILDLSMGQIKMNEDILSVLIEIAFYNSEACLLVIQHGGLKLLKRLCNSFFHKPSGFRQSFRFNKEMYLSEESEAIQLLAMEFISSVTSHREIHLVDMLIDEEFLPLIFQEIRFGMTADIRTEAIKIINNIFYIKRDFRHSLIQEHDIVSLYCEHFEALKHIVDYFEENKLFALTTLKNIVDYFEEKKLSCQKIRGCGNYDKLKSLLFHKDDEIRRISRFVNEFDKNDGNAHPATRSSENNGSSDKTNENNSLVLRIFKNPLRQKRPPNTQTSEESCTGSKRVRFALEPLNNEHSTSTINAQDNDKFYDFDDHPEFYSSVNSVVVADAERNENTSTRNQSDVDPSAVASSYETTQNETNPLLAPAAQNVTAMPGEIITANDQNSLPEHHFSVSTTTPAATADNLSCVVSPVHHSEALLPLSVQTISSVNDKLPNQNILTPQKSSPPGAINNPLRPLSCNSPNILETVSTNDDETMQNETICHTPAPPIVIALPTELTATNDLIQNNFTSPILSISISTAETTIDNRLSEIFFQSASLQSLSEQITSPTTVASENSNIFPTIKYWHPYEKTIYEYCSLLSIEFNRENYAAFVSKIKFTQITPRSEPGTFHTPMEQSGFGCLSLLLTGTEDQAEKIRYKIDAKFINSLDEPDKFDREKITKVINFLIMLPEHFETVATWLKCRIMIYCYGKWETFGNLGDESIPLFVLEKKLINFEIVYQIVLSLKND